MYFLAAYHTFLAEVYGGCAYSAGTFGTAANCSEGPLAPTGFPTGLVIGLAIGFVLLATAVILHRSHKKATSI
jgi:hypothetical protein